MSAPGPSDGLDPTHRFADRAEGGDAALATLHTAHADDTGRVGLPHRTDGLLAERPGAGQPL